MARASINARWLGVVDADKSCASADSRQLGASSLVSTLRASWTVHTTAGLGQR